MDVLMPQLGETVTEGTVANWHKQVGDRVEADEILLDVETDKVSMEIPSPGSGTLAQILVQAGETVPVGTVLAVVEVVGEAAAGTTARSAASSEPAAASVAATPGGGARAGNGAATESAATAVAAGASRPRAASARAVGR